MVGASDLKVYHSVGVLPSGPQRVGGAITANIISNGSPNNLFFNVTRAEQVSGVDEYKCAYFKNTHATEGMDNFKLWLSSKRSPNDTSIQWGRDPIALTTSGFDGVNDYIDCGNHADLWSGTLTKFSFGLWIWPTAGWDGNLRNVVDHGSAVAQGFRCNIDDIDGNNISFRIRNAAGTEINAHSFDLILQQFNHVVCVYDNSLGSANIKIYVNGVLGAQTGNLTQSITQSAILMIGGSSTDFKGYAKGYHFYKRALTQTEITAWYNGTSPDDASYIIDLSGNTVDDYVTDKVATRNGAYYNLDAQTITATDVPPKNVTWNSLGTEPSSVLIRRVSAGLYFPIWFHFHVEPGAEARLDDSEIMSFKFNIPQGGTGSSGGGGDDGGSGTGGNPPPPSTNYKIAVCGDWGCENATDDVIDLIKNGGYNILVGIGDNAYASSSCWIDRFNSLKSKFLGSAYGNHEYSESGGTGPYKTFFGDNKTYYTFKYQNILFLVIDDNDFEDSSAPSLAVGSTQHNFIKTAITDSLDDNTITWRIALIHHPWFGASSQHENNEGDQAQRLHKLFQDNQVHMVCCGHNHNWQRTHQVSYNSGDPKSPNVVGGSSPYSTAKKGIIHVVSGTGGHDNEGNLYSLGGQPSFQAYQNKSHNGIFEIVASNNGQTLTCSFVSIDGDKFGTFTYNAV